MKRCVCLISLKMVADNGTDLRTVSWPERRHNPFEGYIIPFLRNVPHNDHLPYRSTQRYMPKVNAFLLNETVSFLIQVENN